MLDTFQGGDILKTDFQFEFDLSPNVYWAIEALDQWWIQGQLSYNQQVYSRLSRVAYNLNKEVVKVFRIFSPGLRRQNRPVFSFCDFIVERFCSGCVTENKNFCNAMQWIKSPFSIATVHSLLFFRQIWTNFPPLPGGAQPIWWKTAWVFMSFRLTHLLWMHLRKNLFAKLRTCAWAQ